MVTDDTFTGLPDTFVACLHYGFSDGSCKYKTFFDNRQLKGISPKLF